MEGAKIFTIILLIFCATICPLTIVKFIQRKNFYPIKPRIFWASITTAIHCNFFTLLFLIEILIDFNIPCLILKWGYLWASSSISSGYLLIAIHAHFRGKMTQEVLMMDQVKDGPVLEGWYTKRRHLISRTGLIKMYLGGYFSVIPLGLIYFLVHRHELSFSTLASDPLCLLQTEPFMVTDISICLFGFVLLGLVVKGVEEHLYIRAEFLSVGFVIVCSQVYLFSPGNTSHTSENLGLTFLVLGVFLLETWLPIGLTYGIEKTLKSRNLLVHRQPLVSPSKSEPNLPFRSLLESFHGFFDFQAFLVREFSVENLRFWKDVCKLEKLCKEGLTIVGSDEKPSHTQPEPVLPQELTVEISPRSPPETPPETLTSPQPTSPSGAKATFDFPTQQCEAELKNVTEEKKKLIIFQETCEHLTNLVYSNYVAPTAPYSVNISGRNRDKIEETMNKDFSKYEMKENSEHDFIASFQFFLRLFRDAKVEVFDLMETDSYPRYLATKERDSQMDRSSQILSLADLSERPGVGRKDTNF